MNPYALLFASVKGYSHIRSGQECQDSFQFEKLEDGALLLSVADGHGSKACPYSKTGSEVAVNVFGKILSEIYRREWENRDALVRFLAREGSMGLAQIIEKTWKNCVAKVHRDMLRPVPAHDDGRENLPALYRMYGSTLLGALIAPDFVFAFQLGDGDIVYADDRGVQSLVAADKLLGVESDSLCGSDAWKKAVSALYVREWDRGRPYFLQLSTDGFANSFVSDEEFHKTCGEYLQMLKQYGADAVQKNLESWLDETSRLGCGDDTTALIAYFAAPEAPETEKNGPEEMSAPECRTSEAPAPGEALTPDEGSNAHTAQISDEQEVYDESSSDLTEMSEGEQDLWDPSSADERWGMVQDLGVSH